MILVIIAVNSHHQNYNIDDGDQCNVFRIYGLDLGKRFSKALNPRFNMYISRMTGKFEPKMLPIKDEVATFWAMNNI